MKAAIFTIGTELVDGEIINTNAAWLAQQLDYYGLTVTHHISTSDRESDMREVLEWLITKVDWVFVSGGLGPTSDDRTRNVVADVVGDKLVYSENVWRQLGENYRARGFEVTDDHKRQCCFPENCEKLENPVGSALGFLSQALESTVVVLPGPPSELKGVFARGVEPRIKDLGLKKATLVQWVCLGITESGVAERVEEAVGGGDLEIGYRVQLPYVYVKVWIPNRGDYQTIVDTIDSVIGQYCVGSGTVDPANGFLEALGAFPDHQLQFSDRLSGGELVDRLYDLNVFGTHSVEISNLAENDTSHGKRLRLSVGADDQHTVQALIEIDGNTTSRVLQAPPYHADLETRRTRKYYSEQALHAWTAMLREMYH